MYAILEYVRRLSFLSGGLADRKTKLHWLFFSLSSKPQQRSIGKHNNSFDEKYADKVKIWIFFFQKFSSYFFHHVTQNDTLN